MCGICGAVSMTTPKSACLEVVQAMAATLTHRGPDESGYFVRFQRDGNPPFAALGHTRLSIVDLNSGRQPLYNEDRSILVIANGEIYNYPELAVLLRARGHRLATSSDCEAIVHLYEDYGLDFLRHLKGMFALALWDETKGRLILARDRMGKKPLYYFTGLDNLVFASELKAILRHPIVGRELDLKSFAKYLSYEYIPAPATIFTNVRKLEPGAFLVWQRGGQQREFYWDLQLDERPHGVLKEEEYVERLDELFQIAVKRRLMSDVEVGVLLSGGVDSSLVAVQASRLYGQPMRAFNISFEDKTYDEQEYAIQAAQVAGIKLESERCTEGALLNIVGKMGEILDEPFADPSFVPTYLLSQITAQRVRVALSGDGGDDIMAGYVTFPAVKLVNFYKILPVGLRSLINRRVSRMSVSHRYLSLDFKLKQFMRGAGYATELMYFQWLAAFNDQEKQNLLLPEHNRRLEKVKIHEDIIGYLGQSGLTRDLERILYLTMKLYLQDDILVKVDRASMACSLEVRSPFLDHELVEFVNQVPMDLKLKGLTTKYLLKKVAAKYLPARIVNRKKKGFAMPIARWFRKELRGPLTDYLSPRRLSAEGYFNPAYVEGLVREHLEGKANHYKKLWTLLVFELWREKWLASYQQNDHAIDHVAALRLHQVG